MIKSTISHILLYFSYVQNYPTNNMNHAFSLGISSAQHRPTHFRTFDVQSVGIYKLIIWAAKTEQTELIQRLIIMTCLQSTKFIL